MKYLVAVSGGVDSVVLLDMLVRRGDHELVVAHFDHGIRPDSADDARFVKALAEKYGVGFVTAREELGEGASEELARRRRYAFLRREAANQQAIIVTAHHQDDVCETIAINLTRGTGWRGLAVLESLTIIRPLLDMAKQELRTYARDHRLEWVEDITNSSDVYLRNRLRRRLKRWLPDHKQELVELWHKQLATKTEIDEAVQPYLRSDGEYSRYFMIMINRETATELLRAMIADKIGFSLTRPQLGRVLLAVKTARSGSIFEAGSGVRLVFTAKTFIVQTP
jgi:tRNA(Ile)-lysidine synthetase-like protein